jgi:hypothetical protein
VSKSNKKSPGKIDSAQIGAKFYLNGLPKSGLHLLAQMVKPVAKQMPEDQFEAPWVGMFQGRSYRIERAPTGQITFGIGRTKEGHFMKGHCGYDPIVDAFLNFLGILHIFVYRDLRDVAVSQAFHVLAADNKRLFHPDPKLYQKLGSFENVITAVIEGIDVYPGVLERWELYAPWMEIDWVLKLSFEDMRHEPVESAANILQYTILRLATILRSEAVVDTEIARHTVDLMVASAGARHLSPTFRKGKTGSWRDHFTEEHVDLFKKLDTENWLIKLGYEEDDSWGLQSD